MAAMIPAAARITAANTSRTTSRSFIGRRVWTWNNHPERHRSSANPLNQLNGGLVDDDLAVGVGVVPKPLHQRERQPINFGVLFVKYGHGMGGDGYLIETRVLSPPNSNASFCSGVSRVWRAAANSGRG